MLQTYYKSDSEYTKMTDTVSELKTLIGSSLDIDLNLEDIDESASFFEGGLNVDSIAIVELIVLIEERFSISFDDADLVPETFQTLGVLAGKVDAKLSASAREVNAG